MDNSANLFAKLLMSSIVASNKGRGYSLTYMETDTMWNRMQCYHDLVRTFGLLETTESFMRLLVEVSGDVKTKRYLWDEFNMVI
jgi:hypothetical protein